MSPHVAFVHDRIYHMGGAEAVLIDLIKDYIDQNPVNEIRIFTLFSNQQFLEVNHKKIQIITALPRWLFAIFHWFERHEIWGISKLFDYRNLMFFYPMLVRILRRKVRAYQPNQIIVSGFAAVKNIVPIYHPSNDFITSSPRPLAHPKTSLYLHSPMQYIWDYYEENLTKLKFPIRQFYQLITPVLRTRDKTPRHYDRIIANSKYTAHGAKRLYGRDSEVHYPGLHPLYQGVEVMEQSDYYIFVGRLVRFAKDLEIIIRLFNYTGDKLIIAGSGPDEFYLSSIARPNIIFVGQILDIHEKMGFVGPARGLINLTRESFGMVTLEALCQGVPVFGYRQGGSVELVDIESGILVDDKSLEHLIDTFTQFKNTQRDRDTIAYSGKSLLNNSHYFVSTNTGV